jgi:antitoxin (DNA-binding transcriptional repressor) of toxin-antitoxin stability system
MTSGEAREGLRQLLTDVDKGEHVEIHRYRSAVAVVVPVEWYEKAVEALNNEK